MSRDRHGSYVAIRPTHGFDQGTHTTDLSREIGEQIGGRWRDPEPRHLRPTEPVPYTGGSDYSGDRTTAANRAYWLSEVDPDGLFSVEVHSSYGGREIYVRSTLARIARSDDPGRWLELLSRIVSDDDRFRAAHEIVDTLTRLDQYPCLDEDAETEIAQGWAESSWRSYGQHDCAPQVAHWLERLGVDVSEDLADDLAAACTLEDWAYLSGEFAGRGTWHDDGGEDRVHLGDLCEGSARDWIDRLDPYERTTLRDLIHLTIACHVGEHAEPDLAGDLAIAVHSGRVSYTDALRRASSAKSSSLEV